jgi:hypothetical protein
MLLESWDLDGMVTLGCDHFDTHKYLVSIRNNLHFLSHECLGFITCY